MSEKTPEDPYESEPQGTDSMETPTPEYPASDPESLAQAPEYQASDPESLAHAPEHQTSASESQASAPDHIASDHTAPTAESTVPTPRRAVPLATEAGQFRTAPMDMDLPFAGQAVPEPTDRSTSQPTLQEAPQSTQQNPTQQASSQQYPTQQYTRAYPQNPTYPHASPQTLAYPRSHDQVHAQAQGPQAQGPAVPQTVNPGHAPGGHAPNITAPYGQMPVPAGRPPRRGKRTRPENVMYAPVTGSLPLTDRDVTDIPADEPVSWPRKRIGVAGVANLFLSAVMAVIWAWIPLGLLFTGIGGIFALGLGVLALVLWVIVQQGANVFERYRAELIYGDRIPVPRIERSVREPGFTRFLHNKWLLVKSGSFWRSTAHHYVKMMLGAVVVIGTLGGICGAVLGIFGAINPDGITTFFLGGPTGGLGRVGVAIGALIVLASSVAILWFAPYLDRALDRSLLPPARTAALQAEVTELDRARMAGIDAAAAERLRIERDLHDGAQPRLVALSMTLGMAKAKIDTDPERAKELVSEAHAEAKGIVNELRQLARGIHPAVLTDRGLDAAVSALAGRSPIPVEVDVRLDGRIEREAEAVAYFVVAECLTNISKHSGATHARVLIAPVETGVQIVVTDNGCGGARIDRSGRHTGIAGLVDRVEAARGTLNLTSPTGGPTTVVVEVPCAS